MVSSSAFSPLSASEIELKSQLENTVSQAFLVAGQALKTLRDRRFYRETHSTFELYVQDKFGYKKSAAYYLINASEIVNNLKCPQFVDKISAVEIWPTSESQCRPLAKLAPEQQRKVWFKAVELAGNKVPPARIIKQVVQEIKGEPKMIDPQHKKDGPVLVPGIGIEYIAVLDEETHSSLKEYMQRVGKATFNGAIRQLLEQENHRLRQQ